MLILQIFLILLLLILLGVMFFQLFTYPFYMYAMVRGAFYAPTHHDKVALMLQIVKGRKMKKMVDLGSGDGRIVAAFAKQGVEAEGFEINPILVWRSRFLLWRAWRKGELHAPATISLQDFWFRNFSEYDLITVYGIPHIMEKLSKKLNKEVKPGTLIISNAFALPGWKVKKKLDDVLLYEKN